MLDWPNRWAWVILPVVPVLLYSIALWVSQHFYLVSHSPAIANSPYILGFMLTLVALLDLFLRGGTSIVDGEIDQDLVLGRVGAAVATTAVGLLSRQVLITNNIQLEDQDQVFQSLARQLKKNARDFQSAQKQLVALIQEFVEAREELFSKEEQAYAKFLDDLDRGSQILARIETEYSTRLSSALDALGAHVEDLDTGVTSAAGDLRTLTATAKQGAEEIRGSATTVAGTLHDSSTLWKTASAEAVGSLDASNQVILERVESLTALQAKLDALSGSIDATIQSLGTVPEHANAMFERWDATSKSNHEQIAAMYSDLFADAKAMNMIVDEVAELLRKRVDNLK